tara:strand:+ start:527 stop:730 length:204 start_codon:yes stop_codon:yes gene_type:complete
MSEKDGGPAYPSEYSLRTNQGMTLRDWFAGKALSGITRMLNDPMIPASACAQMAYHLADEMLKERAK